MKFKLLGTAAAEGWPALFCTCEHCEKAERLKGKNIRTRSSCLIDEDLLVDFGPDTYMHKLMFNLDLSKLSGIILTHSHSDHFVPTDLIYWNDGFAHMKENKKLEIYGNKICEDVYESETKREMPENNKLHYNYIEPWKPFKINNKTITPLLANHAQNEDCYIFIIEEDGKTLLYGNDSGYFRDETWQEISNHKFNGVILEGTMGMLGGCYSHMGLDTDIEVKKRIIQMGAADDSTVFITTHFSHNIGLMHEDIEKIVNSEGIIVAYDGIEITL